MMVDPPVELSQIDVVSDVAYRAGVPHDQFARLRRHAPVFRQKVPDPTLVDEVWVVSSAELVQRVGMDAETFSSRANGILLRARRTGEGARVNDGNFINLDPPDHGRMRGMVAAACTPRVVRAFAQRYGAITARVVADAVGRGEFDLVGDVAEQLPLLAICELLGVPPADRDRVLRWSNTVLGLDDPANAGDPLAADRAVAELGAYALELADAKRRDGSAADLMSQLACAPPGQRLTDRELEGFVLLLLVAGSETTRHNIAHGVVALMDHPEQWDALRAGLGTSAGEALLDAAVEEITRFVSPVNYMGRTATREVELGGQRIAAGDRVAMFYCSANRDEAVFPGGDRFDITHFGPGGYRRHFAFGHGRHICLGAHLARVGTRTALAELLARCERIHPAGRLQRRPSSFLNGSPVSPSP